MAHRSLVRGPGRHRIAVAGLIAACLALVAPTAARAGKDDPLSFDRQRMKIVLDNVAKTIEKNPPAKAKRPAYTDRSGK